MQTLREAAEEFLSQRRIAVAGVSRDPRQPANLIYRRLRDTGHEVFAVNPNADVVEDGERCFASVSAIPQPPDGVVIVTPPEQTAAVAQDSAEAGVPRVWIHRGLGPGSTSDAAVAYCREHGVSVIPGGCPNMFGQTSDPGHRCMKVALSLGGRLPRSIPDASSTAGDSARAG
jgi:predicted CoA-binding protein